MPAPFTVESSVPPGAGVDENDEPIDRVLKTRVGAKQSFPQIILENLKTAGVQQAHKEDRITFTSLTPWPGELVCAEGRYLEGDTEKRAAIFIGPEFGTVQRADLVAAAREAGDAGFDVLIACAFNYEAHTTEFTKLGRIPVLKARMNADLHMAEDLKNTGKGTCSSSSASRTLRSSRRMVKAARKVNGVDVFKPQTGEVISDGATVSLAGSWTPITTKKLFVRHAYFWCQRPLWCSQDHLKAEINAEAWASLNSDTSRPFERPEERTDRREGDQSPRDEVMKVFKVPEQP